MVVTGERSHPRPAGVAAATHYTRFDHPGRVGEEQSIHTRIRSPRHALFPFLRFQELFVGLSTTTLSPFFDILILPSTTIRLRAMLQPRSGETRPCQGLYCLRPRPPYL